jgi:tetratricopeptide (TPR) repeat protein
VRPELKGRNPALAVLGLIAVLTLAVILVISLLRGGEQETTLPTLASFGTPVDTTQPTAVGTPSAEISFYDVPVIPVDEAQAAVRQNPNDPAAYLTLARALWAANRPQEAQQAIADGLGVVDDLVKYLLTAGKISDEDGNVTAAVFLYAEALNRAQANPERYPAVRNYVGEYVYGIALAPEGFNAAELARLKNSAGAGSDTQTTLLDIMAARILITEDRLRLAETALRRLPTEAASLPETALVRGELLAAQGNMERAQTEWQALMTAPDSPEWVLARATELLNAADSGA